MAHIILRSPHPAEGAPAMQLIINGVDVSADVFDGIQLVKVGEEPEYQQVGLQVTYAVASLDINGVDTTATDQFETIAHEVAQLVQSSRASA